MPAPRFPPWLLVGLAATACREPTQITVRITTNLPCTVLDGVNIIVGPASTIDSRAPSASTNYCDASGKVGSIVILPSGSGDEPVAIAIVAGTRNADPSLTTAANDCAASNNARCIVARRALGFIPHTPLVLPIALTSSCIGVACAADASGPRTCVDGMCTSAVIDPSRCTDPGGCALDQDAGAPPTDGGVAGNVRELALGRQHSCALMKDGTVQCWGDNTQGQLGIGDPNTVTKTTPVPVPGLTGVLHLSAFSETNTCAVMGDGTLKCWGGVCCGQLAGSGGTTQYAPFTLQGIAGVTTVAVGRQHVCAQGGTPGPIACWGTPWTTPSALGGLSGPVDTLASGDRLAVMRMMNGTVQVAGENVNGGLGLGLDAGTTTSAVTIPGLTSVTGVAVGNACVLATLSNGNVMVWGQSGSNQLSLATFDNVPTPTPAPALFGLHGFAMGDQHGCALDAQNAVVCWGDGTLGQLGPSVTTRVPDPVHIGLTAVRIFSGWAHDCAITASGEVYCWGANDSAQLGDGTKVNRPVPVKLGL